MMFFLRHGINVNRSLDMLGGGSALLQTRLLGNRTLMDQCNYWYRKPLRLARKRYISKQLPRVDILETYLGLADRIATKEDTSTEHCGLSPVVLLSHRRYVLLRATKQLGKFNNKLLPFPLRLSQEKEFDMLE